MNAHSGLSDSQRCARDPMCITTEEVPLLRNVRTGLIDPDTPKSAYTKKSHQGQTLNLVVGSNDISCDEAYLLSFLMSSTRTEGRSTRATIRTGRLSTSGTAS